MRIEEVLKKIGDRPIPRCPADMHIDSVVRMIAKTRHSQVVYVVDELERMIGIISVDKLIRHLYPHHYEARVTAHGLLERITAEAAETAGSLMDSRHVHAIMDDTVDDVLNRMAKTGLNEMAVLDEAGCVVGDLTAADLLHFYYLEHYKGAETD